MIESVEGFPQVRSSALLETIVGDQGTPLNRMQLSEASILARSPGSADQQNHTRQTNRRSLSSFQFATFVVLVVLSILSGNTVSAKPGVGAPPGDLRRSSLSANAPRIGQLFVDHRSGLAKIQRMRRQDNEETANTATTVSPPSSTTTAESTAVTSDAPESTLTELPMPFDTSLGSNFTVQSCPDFFQGFLLNSTFESCLPFSLLLQNSVSFFNAGKSLVRLTQTLDATCDVNYDSCKSLMAFYAQEIPKDTVCGSDLRLGNPTVTQALNGFLSYQPMYQAGCMKDDESSYCFANAFMNASSPSDSYIYSLPLGTNLPGGSRPTCNKCLTDTMAVFGVSAGNSSQPLSKTYSQAASQINMGCGPNFVNATVTQLSAADRPLGGLAPTIALAVTLLSLFI